MASPSSTSPVPAACSSIVTPVAVGPSTTNSRCMAGFPASTRWTGPDSTPADARSFTRPIEVVARPIWARTRCIRSAARAARQPWSGPSKRSRRASPPHLSKSPPSSSASVSSRPNTSSRRLLSSSAPSRPRRASRSVSGVKPVMSNSSRLPSMTRWAGPSSAAAQAGSSRGTYAARGGALLGRRQPNFAGAHS